MIHMKITEKNYLLFFLDFCKKNKIKAFTLSSQIVTNNFNYNNLPLNIEFGKTQASYQREIINFHSLFLELIQKKSFDEIIKVYDLKENTNFFTDFLNELETEQEKKDFFKISLKFYNNNAYNFFIKIIQMNDNDFLKYTGELENFTGRKTPKYISEAMLQRLLKADSTNQKKYLQSFYKIIQYFRSNMKDIQNKIHIENIIENKIDSSFYAEIEKNTKIIINFKKEDLEPQIINTIALKFDKENLYKNIVFKNAIINNYSTSLNFYNRFMEDINSFLMNKKEKLHIVNIHKTELLTNTDWITIYFEVNDKANIQEIKDVYKNLMLNICSIYVIDNSKNSITNDILEKTWNHYWLDKELMISSNQEDLKNKKLKI